MRMKLYLDPQDLITIIGNKDYPTIRQVLDEIYCSGNIDINLWSDSINTSKIKEFIDDFYLMDLINEILDEKGKIRNSTESDIVADKDEKLIKNFNHILLSDDFKPLVRFFVPNSKMLDDIYLIINSKDFISSIFNTLHYIDINNIIINNEQGDSVIADYLTIEARYIYLLNQLINNPLKRTAHFDNFMVARTHKGYKFLFKGYNNNEMSKL